MQDLDHINPYLAIEEGLSSTAFQTCAICGQFFTPTRATQKYCETCRVNSGNAKQKVDRAVQKNRRTYNEPKVYDFTCIQCNKPFKTIRKLLFTVPSGDMAHLDTPEELWGTGKVVFCRESCKKEYYLEHAKCHWCGKSLKGNDHYIYGRPSTQYCNDDFRREELLEYARRGGKTKHCVNCGKEYIGRDNSFFCSKTCSSEAKKNGWISPITLKRREEEKRIREKDTLTVNFECPICGRHKMLEIPKSTTKIPTWCCCDEHKKEYIRRVKLQNSIDR